MIRPAKMIDSGHFLQEVERLTNETGCDYMEAVIHLAEAKGLEIETVASMIKGSSKAKSVLQESAERLNYLPKTARLPI